ncbi:MAG: hypothetical protein ACTHYR_04275 [Brachybacterium sp.]
MTIPQFIADAAARQVGWAETDDLDGLPRRKQISIMASWIRDGVSLRARRTPLDTVTNDLALLRERLLPATTVPLTDSTRRILREDVRWREAAAYQELDGEAIDLRKIPTDVRERLAVALERSARLRRADIGEMGGWAHAQRVRETYALSLKMSPPRALAEQRLQCPGRCTRYVRSRADRAKEARQGRFLRQALRFRDDNSLVLSTAMPAWLRRAADGVHISYPEEGNPQICRFDDYIDWRTLLDQHSDQLSITEGDWPTSAPLHIVDDARRRGHDAFVDAALWLDGFSVTGRPRFALEAWGVIIDRSLPMGLADRYTDQIRRNQQWAQPASDISYSYEPYDISCERSTQPLSELIAAAPPRETPPTADEPHYWYFH